VVCVLIESGRVYGRALVLLKTRAQRLGKERPRGSKNSAVFARMPEADTIRPAPPIVVGVVQGKERAMAEERKGAVTLRGNPLTLSGSEIKVGQNAPDFTVVDNNLQPARLSDAKGKVVILSAVPSVDTAVCDTETRQFNQEASA